MKMQFKGIVGIVILSVFAFACKPSAERETKKWATNVQKVNALMSEYSAFKPVLEKNLADAQKIWTEATAIKDEEKKAKRMSEANDVIDNAVVRGLSSVQSRIESINSKYKKLANMTMPKSNLDKARNALSNANEKKREAKKILAEADGSNMESADKAVKDANGKLIDAENGLSSAISSASTKKKK